MGAKASWDRGSTIGKTVDNFHAGQKVLICLDNDNAFNGCLARVLPTASCPDCPEDQVPVRVYAVSGHKNQFGANKVGSKTNVEPRNLKYLNSEMAKYKQKLARQAARKARKTNPAAPAKAQPPRRTRSRSGSTRSRNGSISEKQMDPSASQPAS